MLESALWRAFLLFAVHLSFSREESFEVTGFPVNEIPVRNTWDSLEKYEYDQDLPKHRAHVEFFPVYKESKPKHKQVKKVNKMMVMDSTTKTAKKNRRNGKRKNIKSKKVKKKRKSNLGDKRQPFDITVHIKMDDA